ncbi:hypothetical protein EVAR_73052_1 [Eumeta japonica]|uniref:Peptidase S1 domain-containing protein n=1 Tax=Eumeta variegata TaxID=151549 RepID=A0A4C1TPI3_EUMVA|nr:hypothetical protein EVAR_73052_1 [Eumeta japonica]
MLEGVATKERRLTHQTTDYHLLKIKYQEEYAGAPVQCLIPGTNQWALVGVSSWRIACAASGVERPRMYDKISSNTAWIHETVNSS